MEETTYSFEMIGSRGKPYSHKFTDSLTRADIELLLKTGNAEFWAADPEALEVRRQVEAELFDHAKECDFPLERCRCLSKCPALPRELDAASGVCGSELRAWPRAVLERFPALTRSPYLGVGVHFKMPQCETHGCIPFKEA